MVVIRLEDESAYLPASPGGRSQAGLGPAMRDRLLAAKAEQQVGGGLVCGGEREFFELV